MTHIKHEIARALEQCRILWRRPEEDPKNKTRAGQGNGFQGEIQETTADKDTTSSDHDQAIQFTDSDIASYDAEIARKAPIRSFRAAGNALLPLTIWDVNAEDFGNTHILTTAQGGELFNHQERQFVLWIKEALERVLRGGV
jgi:hypothetical protein